MIKLFHSVVRLFTSVSFLTIPPFYNQVAHLRLVGAKWPPLVLFLVVIVRTAFQVVTVRINFTRGDLKESEVQELAILVLFDAVTS